MSPKIIATTLAVAFFLASPLLGQMLGTYSSAVDAYQDRCDADPAATAMGVCPEGAFGVPLRPASAWPAGAVTANHPGRLLLMTDGVNDIIRFLHPRIGLPGGGGALPPLIIPAPYAGAGVPITGMTMNPFNQNIFLTDGAQISEHNPAAGMAMVAGPWAIPLVAGAPFFAVGLDLDLCSGHLYAVDPNGTVARLDIVPGGLAVIAVNAWPWGGMLPPGALATGVAIDRCAVSPCAGAMLQPYYVSFDSGHVIKDAGIAIPGVLASQGLTYTAVPIRLASPGGVMPLRARVGSFLHEGLPNSLELSGVAAGIPVAYLGVSVGLLPAPGVALPSGDTLWIDPALIPPGLVPLPAFPVAPGGTVTVPLGPPPYPFNAYLQWVVPNPATLMLELSNALNFEISRL